MEIILGSQSPRRRELMAGLDLPFTLYISRAKAQAYAPQLQPDQLLITADTIVWLDGQMLGKPHDEAEAITMLRRLSGKTHQVYTAVTFARILQTENSPLKDFSQLSTLNSQLVLETIVDKTDVTFKDLSDEEIRHYVTQYRPLDKAGAYGVQEWIGYIACIAMNGSYFNVMGFPVHRVYEQLKNRGII